MQLLSPFAIPTAQPDILLGRTGQVSILNTAVNHGHLANPDSKIVQSLGMFLWHGRHDFASQSCWSACV
ncbi:MAG: hypothetical protein H6669_05470 [Ardenticatenaceae bacterium]|nr:hypothetical protein [Ardenticatenaceae bacterium]